jgi:hypothetical protein
MQEKYVLKGSIVYMLAACKITYSLEIMEGVGKKAYGWHNLPEIVDGDVDDLPQDNQGVGDVCGHASLYPIAGGQGNVVDSLLL